MHHSVKKADCTPEEWEKVSAIRREQQYTSHRHLGDEANFWLQKPWSKVKKRHSED